MKCTILWDVTLCSLIEVSQHFGGTYYLHLQSVNRARNQEYSCCLRLAGCLLGLLFDSEYGGSTFLRNVRELVPDFTASHPRRLLSPLIILLCFQ
jgi:hypothetical protein